MSPVYLNPQQYSSSIPFLDLKGDHSLQMIGHVHDLVTSSNNNFFPHTSLENQHALIENLALYQSRQAHHDKVDKMFLSHDKPNDLGQVVPSSSWSQNSVDGSGFSHAYPFDQRDPRDLNIKIIMNNDHKKPKKLKPSKLKITHKSTTNTKNIGERKLHHDHGQRQTNMYGSNGNENTNGVRVCTDCHTTTTPLWRSGPQGPKSLCNACGIRQRKARKAMAAAAEAAAGCAKEGIVASSSTSSSSFIESPKPIVKDVKSERIIDQDRNHTLPIKKRSKAIDHGARNYDNNSFNGDKPYFEDFPLNSSKSFMTSNSQRVFPQDEEEGARLLMALSNGWDKQLVIHRNL